MEQLTSEKIKKTLLYERHCALGAKMADFYGWQMPIQYKGALAEHNAVRKGAGLFDVSHMGRIKISGKEAKPFISYLATNKIRKTTTYTVLADEKGGSVDDVLIFQEDPENFCLVANASNRQKDLEHIQKTAKPYAVEVAPLFDKEGILALQGPEAAALLATLFPEAEKLKPFSFIQIAYKGGALFLSRTGYTGEDGFEIYVPNSLIGELWDHLLASKIAMPAGLGARDTLRLEMGLALYGHELSDKIAPTESVSRWTVKFDKEAFLGKEALLKLEDSPEKRNAYGALLLDRGIAREGHPVFYREKKIGEVTSGTHSPTLKRSIALLLVSETLSFDEEVEIEIRGRRCRAQISKLPFLQRGEA